MTTTAVIGATGTLGRHIVAALREDGQDVRALGRTSNPVAVDLTTGAGLDRALIGCDMVIDASNGSPRRPEPVHVEGARRLSAAAAAAGIGHLVCVSIGGPEAVRLGDLARAWAAARGRRALPVRIPLPPALGRPLRAGALTCPDPDRRGEIPFTAWLTTHS
jgi:uncharacterized protein YbjT (DUF2867 family)